MLEPDLRPHNQYSGGSNILRGAGWTCLGAMCVVLVLMAAKFLPSGRINEGVVPVSRAATEMIELPQPIRNLSPDPVSIQIQRPVRVTDTSAQAHDLFSLVGAALEAHNYTVRRDDRLLILLVQVLAERQSDAYIDAMLDTALLRGEIDLPDDLVAADGSADTDALLASILDIATG